MSYWHQRDITDRLIAARFERKAVAECDSAIDSLFAQLPAHMILAIANELNDGGCLTQYRIEDYDG